ncbi:MAG TPA: SGNH/GDSL hydrolase family protein [Vicinamibacterales bacterium]|nr:SGNH/GDSL hydrolase family protein [Vicinamibacterales bacterium]
MSPLSRRKKIVFSLVTVTLSFVVMTGLLLVADLIVHHRAERSAGLNRRGYRGPVIPPKQPGELRVVMVGGSTVFGYGVAWNESIPAFLESKLHERLKRPVRVVNLGFNNEGAHAFLANLEDFAYLDYDVAVLYEGYNDLPGDAGPNRAVYRRDSAIYRAFGYYPILPLYLEEKARSLQFGNVNAAYEAAERKPPDSQVVFRPGLATRTSAAALQAISSVTRALDGQLARTSVAPLPAVKESESKLGCNDPYVTYCESVAVAVRYGLTRGHGVVVGSQPRAIGAVSHDRHTRQQSMLASMMAREFGGEPRVAFADCSGVIDLNNVDYTFDGMHLKPEANATVAAALVEPVVRVAEAAKR